ncbi:HSP20-like chaperone [Corchorus olitorius]|uniref:Co-chaperone protein p23 n=1 Tax=Corchorus olitorius TaxID=93759 RepID=A0A1R3IH62_9ROSI|nr:HSP20-like chaperone [Corchorus olitorius]
MSRHPEVKWAQRTDKVFITVLLPDSKNAKVNLDPEGVFTFSANAGADNNLYELKLDLHDKVNVEESKINYGVRSIFCILEKAEKVWWKKLLRGDVKPPHYVKVDWDKWVDEDEESGQEVTKPDANKAEGDAKPEQAAGTSEK